MISRVQKMGDRNDASLVLLQDIVIPAGTIIKTGPVSTEWNETNFSHLVAFGKDGVGEFVIGISDARTSPHLFKEVKDANS